MVTWSGGGHAEKIAGQRKLKNLVVKNDRVKFGMNSTVSAEGQLDSDMGESSKFPESSTFEIQIIKIAVYLRNNISNLHGYLSLYQM